MNTIKRYTSVSERIMPKIFFFCAILTVAAVASITCYMIMSGFPALSKVGVKEILFSSVWQPTASDPKFGIGYIILTSFAGTICAILIGVPIGIATALCLCFFAPKKLADIIRISVELLAGIPSVIYGLLGIMILNPIMFQLEMYLFKDSENHQFTGGANLISAIFVLAIMILPTVISISETALKAVPIHLRDASFALGATKVQTILMVMIPSAKSGIMTAIILGVGRAIGEAMAISLVSGNAVSFPLPFHSVRFLTTAIVSEMSYAADLHREVLFTIGLVLFVFIIIINLFVAKMIKKKGRAYE